MGFAFEMEGGLGSEGRRQEKRIQCGMALNGISPQIELSLPKINKIQTWEYKLT